MSSPPPAELTLQFDELDYSASLDPKFVSDDDDNNDSISNFGSYLDLLELVSNQSLKPSPTVSVSTQTDDAIGTDPNGTLPIGTDSNETLASVALSLISCNLPAVLFFSKHCTPSCKDGSAIHQALSGIDRHSTETCSRSSPATARRPSLSLWHLFGSTSCHSNDVHEQTLLHLASSPKAPFCLFLEHSSKRSMHTGNEESIWFLDRKPYRVDSRRSRSTSFQPSCVLIKRRVAPSHLLALACRVLRHTTQDRARVESIRPTCLFTTIYRTVQTVLQPPQQAVARCKRHLATNDGPPPH